MPALQQRRLPPYIWSFTTYFAEGFPYTIIRTISSVFFRDRGMSLEAIGLTSMYGLPWILKFLWAPQVDAYGTKRVWLLSSEGILVLFLLATALLAPLSAAPLLIAVLFFAGAFVAATHDVAIDGYYMEVLDERGQSKFIGYRVMAYRIAMMTGTGIIVTIGTRIGWTPAFAGSFGMLCLLFGFHFFYLPECQQPGKTFGVLLVRASRPELLKWPAAAAIAILLLHFLTGSHLYQALTEEVPALKSFTFSAWIGLLLLFSLICAGVFRRKITAWLTRDPESYYAGAFLSFMDREKISVILLFIIFIRTGEFMLTAMAAPFMVDLGIKVHYGWISGAVGLPCSIIGALIGGWLIARFSLHRMIWPFLLAQNFTNLVYMALAFYLARYLAINTGNVNPTPLGASNIFYIAAVHGFDQLAGGLGTAVLMTFLMRLCKATHKAAHYAIGTGLMSVSGLYAGVLSGFLASWFGYGYFFGISFLLSIPGMLLIPTLPKEVLR
ncbi:MAG: MFS transporter [Deltaproteobacteria bacterium]